VALITHEEKAMEAIAATNVEALEIVVTNDETEADTATLTSETTTNYLRVSPYCS
jgi:hypothetical protein